MVEVDKMNACIQGRLKKNKFDKVKASEAAKWLDEDGLLKDDPGRPGRMLRVYLKDDILGAFKEKNLWYIHAVEKEKSRPAAKVKAEPKEPEVEKSSFKNLDECYAVLNDEKALRRLSDSDPLSLVSNIRDLVRVFVMQLATDKFEEYDEKTNMVDTVSMLYSNKLIGKISVQCLHIIRKLGNLAAHESEQFNQSSGQYTARVVSNAFIIFYEEAKENKLFS